MRALKKVTSEKLVQADELEAAQTRNEHLKLQLTDMAERAVEQEKALLSLQQELEAERQRRRDEDTARKQSVRLVPGEVFSNDHCGEDSVIPRRRQNRVSAASSLNTESSSSSADSIFSQASPGPYSPTTSAGASPVLKHVPLFATDNTRALNAGNPRSQMEPSECMRCRLSPSEAWAVVEIVQLESRALKNRIAELESAQEDALDFLSGLGVSSNK